MKCAGIVTRGIALALVTALAGCSSDDAYSDRIDMLRQLASQSGIGGGDGDDDAEGAGARAARVPEVQPEAFAGVTEPVLLAVIPARDATATLGQTGRNGDVVTWSTADNTTLALRDGALVATRNLGDDLISADVAQTRALIAAGEAGRAIRTHRRLGPDLQLSATRYDCEVTPGPRETLEILGQPRQTRRFEERCRGEDDEFVNIFWRDRSRDFIWQSRQWVGPEIGEVVLQRLVE